MRLMLFQDKKGVSEMVGYVLLIVIAVSLSVLVYAFLKIYIPPEKASCPADVSLSIEEFRCEGGAVALTLRNRGLFSVDGAYIRIGDPGRVFRQILNDENILFVDYYEDEGMPPDAVWPKNGNPAVYSYSGTGEKTIEIEPVMFVEDEVVLCDKAIITQTVTCGEAGSALTLNINQPSEQYTYTEGQNIPLDFFVTGNNRDSCWYTLDNGVTNTSVSGCDERGQISGDLGALGLGSHTIFVYVNDSSGAIASDSSDFSVEAQEGMIITIDNPTQDGVYEYLNRQLSLPVGYEVTGGTNPVCSAKIVNSSGSRFGPIIQQCVYSNNLNQNNINFPRDGNYYLNVSAQDGPDKESLLRQFWMWISPDVTINSPPPVQGCDAEFRYTPKVRKNNLDFCTAYIFKEGVQTGTEKFEDCITRNKQLTGFNAGNYRIDLYANDTGTPVNTGFDSKSFVIGVGCTGGSNNGGMGVN